MPDTAVTSPNRALRGRRLLRAAAVATAVVVTVLAAAVPDGLAGASPAAVVRGVHVGAVPASVAGAAVPASSATPTPPAPPVGPGTPGEPARPSGAEPLAGAPLPPPVRPPGAGLRAPGADYAWPLHPAPEVVGPFRQPSFRFGRGHRGADLAGTAGQAVLAAREGTVVFAGRVAGRPVVSVDHPDGLRTTYEPVVATVRAGDRVSVGDPLGVLVAGHAGCAGACLHWGVRRGKVDYLDPLVLVRPPRLRLLPPEPA